MVSVRTGVGSEGIAHIAFVGWAADTGTMTTDRRRFGLLAVGVVAAMVLAIPVLGADPSPSAGAPGQTKPDKAAKADRGPEIALTLRGTVVRTTDGKGRPSFTMTVDGTTWELSVGPKWYWGDRSPLAAFVGKSVEVVGTHHQGETELDVDTVDGTALRTSGKPPWAGGPKVVGSIHPGWKAWKVDGKPGKGHGRDGAPGQTKDKSTSD